MAKSKNSGGVAPGNLRQGFRSENIARYIFSAFGTAVSVPPGEDVGIDLLCNLTYNQGCLIFYKSSYGVQIKSEGTEFEYRGKHATTWLSKLEYPLLFANIDKDNSRIKIYSGWNINNYILSLHTDEEDKYPETLRIITSDSDALGTATPDGNIPIGKPILDFDFNDINDDAKLAQYAKVLEEWLEIDNENYVLRRVGISRTFGYTQWETNKTINESVKKWGLQYLYSEFHKERAKKALANNIVLLGVFYRDNYLGSKNDYFKSEFTKIKTFVDGFLPEHLDDFGKSLFKEDL